MRHDLGLTLTAQQWVVNAYTLTFAGFLMLGGRAAELFGRRRVFLTGLTLFTAASLIGGFAQNGAWLIAARAAQGLGGAVLALLIRPQAPAAAPASTSGAPPTGADEEERSSQPAPATLPVSGPGARP
jgi:MFS family permease